MKIKLIVSCIISGHNQVYAHHSDAAIFLAHYQSCDIYNVSSFEGL